MLSYNQSSLSQEQRQAAQHETALNVHIKLMEHSDAIATASSALQDSSTSAQSLVHIYHLVPPLAGGGGSVRLNGAGPSLEGPSLGGPSLGGPSLLGASRSSRAAAPKRRGGPSLGASLESCLAGALEPPQLDGASRAAAHVENHHGKRQNPTYLPTVEIHAQHK